MADRGRHSKKQKEMSIEEVYRKSGETMNRIRKRHRDLEKLRPKHLRWTKSATVLAPMRKQKEMSIEEVYRKSGETMNRIRKRHRDLEKLRPKHLRWTKSATVLKPLRK